VHEIDLAGVTSCDCDDITCLGAALHRAMGFRTCLIAVSDRTKGPELRHILWGVKKRGGGQGLAGILPFDPQERLPTGNWRAMRGRVGRLKILWVD
jgi:hypothetical protein